MNLVAGRTPGGAVWSSPQNMFDAHPDQIAMIRNHCRLLKTRAKAFLMLGKMLHPYELAVPQAAVALSVRRGGKWLKEDVPTPAILTSSWQSPDGRVGHLFVNTAETFQPLKVDLDTRNAPAEASYDAVVWRSTEDDTFRPLWHSRRLPASFSAELKPGEVLFVELRGSGQAKPSGFDRRTDCLIRPTALKAVFLSGTSDSCDEGEHHVLPNGRLSMDGSLALGRFPCSGRGAGQGCAGAEALDCDGFLALRLVLGPSPGVARRALCGDDPPSAAVDEGAPPLRLAA